MELTLQRSGDERFELFYRKQHIGYVYKEIDGFYVFQAKTNTGYWNEYSLRQIADKLETMNEPWNKYIEENLK